MSFKRFLTHSFYFLKTELLTSFTCVLGCVRSGDTTGLTGFLGYENCGFQPRFQGPPLQEALRKVTLGTKLTCSIVLHWMVYPVLYLFRTRTRPCHGTTSGADAVNLLFQRLFCQQRKVQQLLSVVRRQIWHRHGGLETKLRDCGNDQMQQM